LIAVSTIGFGTGWGLTLPSIDAAVSDLVPARFRAGALSLRGSASFAGRAGGPILFAALAATAGYRAVLWLAGLAALGFVALLLAVTRGTPGARLAPE
jgi:MFS family permease